jgi:hypothetical protein
LCVYGGSVDCNVISGLNLSNLWLKITKALR